MSAIQAISSAFYTIMNHNSAYSMMNNNMARMSLLRNAGNFGSVNFRALAEADKRLSCQLLNDSLMYKVSNAMLEKLEKAKKLDKMA